MDEWVRLAKRDGGGGVQNFVAFLTNNINKRIIDGLKTQKRGKESCLRKRVPKDSRLPGSTRDFLKMETLRGIIEKILMAGDKHEDKEKDDTDIDQFTP